MRGITNRIIADGQTLIEPLNATALKDALGVSDPYDSQGIVLSRSGVNARARLEMYLNRSIVSKSYIQTDIPSNGTIELYPYLRSITSIKAYDAEGSETVIDPGDCEIITGDVATIILPDTYYKTVITFTAGYVEGQPEYDVCKEAIIMMVQGMYERRPDILTPDIKAMVSPIKRGHI